MPRVYSVEFSNVSVSAIQDMLAIYAGPSMAFEIHSLQVGQTTATTVGNLQISVRRITANVVTGTGGTAVTPQQVESWNDAAATVTARANDTTKATGNLAASVIFADIYNVVNGYQWIFPPDDRPVIAPGQAASFSLDVAPGSAQTTSGSVTFAEII